MKVLISHPNCFIDSPPYYPLPCPQHREDGYKDSRLRICFRVKSNGELKHSCLPSCSMIYLKHPSFGIQLKHLTTPEKEVTDIWAWEIRNACRMFREAPFLSPHGPGSWLFLMVVSFYPCCGETKSFRRCLIILVISLASINGI